MRQSLLPYLNGALLAARSSEDPPPTRAQRGGDAADTRLTQVLEAHFETVWSVLRRLGVPEGSVDDAAQEVFIVAARKLGSVAVGDERKFLYGIALRVAANARRSQRARRETSDERALLGALSEAPAAETLLDEKRLRESLDEILDGLALDLRTTFVLFELEGFSEREIAEVCSVPLGTVASRLRRARDAFRRAAQRLKTRLSAGELP